ncbi:MFS transporter [Streptomyces sp. 7R007]
MTAVTRAPAAPADAAGRPAHRDGNVLRWLAAYTCSMVGDNVYYLALSWAAVQAGTPAQAGLVMSVSALPRALLMLGGGVVADRFGPRRVVIASDAVRCAAVLAVAGLLLLASPGLWPLAALALVFGAVDAVFMPAVGALPARVTGRGQFARVQGMRGLAIRFANVVGAPLGGLGVALAGAPTAFALAGLLIAASIPLLLGVRVGKPQTDDTQELGGRASTGMRAGEPPTADTRVGTGQTPGGELPADDAQVGSGSASVGVGARGLVVDDGQGVGGRTSVGELPVEDARGGSGYVGVRAGELPAEDAQGGTGPASVGVLGGEPPADEAQGIRGQTPVDDTYGGSGSASVGVLGGEPVERAAWWDLVSGLRYIRRHRVLAPLVVAIALGDLGFVGPLNVGLTLLAGERGWGASGMGGVLAGFGVGAGIASLLLTVLGRLPRAGLVAAHAVLAGSVAIGALAYAPTLAAAVGVALAIGLLAGLSGALCAALLQTQGDPAYLGRVTAVAGLVSLGLAPLSMPLSAAAIGAWGTGPVFVVSALVCGLGGAVMLGVRDLRRAELPR